MLLVHGAWGGAWQFAKIDPLLREHGFDVRRVTLTGLGERAHLATREIGLETHIQDVVNVILFERLENVILVGHSYGGMVITGVADRLPGRIVRLVYLDAFLPNNDESLVSLRKPELAARIDQLAEDGFLIPRWVTPEKPFPKDVPHPVKTTTDRLVLRNQAATAKIPGTYILTVEPGVKPADDDFYLSAERARARGWTVVLMEADHNPHWRKPSETAHLLHSLR
jgi:pimeloyl-ACP methyl ester carboxylesterase